MFFSVDRNEREQFELTVGIDHSTIVVRFETHELEDLGKEIAMELAKLNDPRNVLGGNSL